MSLKRVNFSPLHTFVRATVKNVFQPEPDGFGGTDYILKEVASGAPAFAWNPETGESLGISIEESRTNYITNSGDFLAASWTLGDGGTGSEPTITAGAGSIWGLTAAEIQFNTGAGVTAADLSSIRQGNALPLTAGQKGTAYFIIQSLNGTQEVSLFLSGGTSAYLTVTEEPTIVQFTLTSNVNASYTPGINQRGDMLRTDGRFLIAHAQAEVGDFASSPIITAGTSLTRLADVVTVPDLSGWYNPSEGTFVVEWERSLGLNSLGQVFRVETSSGNLRFIEAIHLSNNSFQVAFGTITSIIPSGQIFEKNKLAINYNTNTSTISYAINGLTAVTANVSEPPSGELLMRVGNSVFAGRSLDGTIANIQYYPQAVSNTQLQELSAL